MSPLFSPTPLMSPGYPLGPCVRYTAVPLNPSMFPLMHGAPEPKPIYCQQPLEASCKLWKNIYVIFPSPKFKGFGSGRYSLNPAVRTNLRPNSDNTLCHVIYGLFGPNFTTFFFQLFQFFNVVWIWSSCFLRSVISDHPSHSLLSSYFLCLFLNQPSS